MIGQYLSNTNEKATVSILQNILELKKAQSGQKRGGNANAMQVGESTLSIKPKHMPALPVRLVLWFFG